MLKRKISFLVIGIISIFALIIGGILGILISQKKFPVTIPFQINISSIPLSGFQNIVPKKDDSVVLPHPSLSSIFADDHSWTATLAAEKRVTMIATGDVIPARSVNFMTLKHNDFTWPFAKTASVVSNADMTFINLETPLLNDCPVRNDGMIFCGDVRHIEGLKYAGVDVASIANNHAGNWGKAGIDETRTLLSQVGIQSPGSDDQPIYKVVKGIRFAFLAYNDIDHEEEGIGWANNEVIAKQIAEARKNADVVIVSFHWGVEYMRQPHPRQIELAHLAIDSGADVIIGNHPHWIQPVELYKGKFIMYAHGNYVFDQEWSEETKLGVIGRYTFYDKQLIDVEYLPLKIVDYGQQYFLEGEQRKSILNMLKTESTILSSPP